MRKKIAIIFAYLENNLGDDIFVQLLCKRYPEADFYVAQPRVHNVSLSALPNLYFSKKMKKLDAAFDEKVVSKGVQKYYSQFDACVVIGGSIFMQNSNMWRRQVIRFKNRLAVSKHLYVIGANWGPFTDNNFLSEYSPLFEKTSDICFRDLDSTSYFHNISSIRYAPDVLLTYGNVHADSENIVVISLIDSSWAGRPKEQYVELKAHSSEYENLLFDVCKEFSDMGYKICLMSFCQTQKDDAAAVRLQERCVEAGIYGVDTFSYTGDIDSAIHELASAKYIIATRFHSMILGWLFNKPTFPIIYDNKQRTVIKDINFPNKYCFLKRIGNISAKDVVLSLQNYISFDRNDYIEKAQNQFKGLDAFMKGEKNVR